MLKNFFSFYGISKFFVYLSLFAPILLIKALFFPFISGKAVFFRGSIDLALLFFGLHLLAHLNNREFWQRFVTKLNHPIVLCVIIFGVMFTLTALIGVNPTQSFWSNFERGEGAFQVLHYVILFLLATFLFTDRKSLERLIVVNVIVSLPIAAYGLLQLLTPINGGNMFVTSPGDRVSGTLGNPSYLAPYLLFTMAFIIYLVVTRRQYLDRFVPLFLTIPGACWVIILISSYSIDPAVNAYVTMLFQKFVVWYIIGAAVLFGLSRLSAFWFQTIALGVIFFFEFYIFLNTGTRGAFLGVIAALLLLAAINCFISRDKHIRIALGSIFIGMVALMGTFFLTHQSDFWRHVPVLNRLINFSSAANDIKPRLWTWGSGVSGALEKPIAGWGAENFAVPFDKYYNPNHYGIESFFDRTHNIFLEYSISGGLLVLLPWLAIFYFYYRRLHRRPKDFWYSVLFVVPVAYLIQGFFLFDTLPIYILFFVFLTFVINTETGEVHLGTEKNSGLRGANIGTAAIMAIGCGILLYGTVLLPIQKNILIVKALVLQNGFMNDVNNGRRPSTTPNQIIEAYHLAMTRYSPVGQEEAVGMYEKFVLSLVENASRNEKLLTNPQARADIRLIVDDANHWYEENKNMYSGLKEQYIDGGINLRAGASFGQSDYLSRGQAMFEDALTKSPTRLEFMRVLIELASLRGDTVSMEKWGRRAALYRPDMFTFDEKTKTAEAISKNP